MIDIRKDVPGLWCDDITFCPERCGWKDCPRNQANIRDRAIPHSFSVEIPQDCPKEQERSVKQMDREKVKKELLELNATAYGLWVHNQKNEFLAQIGNVTDDALALLKEQEATVKQWTKEIEDYQLAHAPDSHDKGEKYQYKKGIWDGLQIAWNIISEGR